MKPTKEIITQEKTNTLSRITDTGTFLAGSRLGSLKAENPNYKDIHPNEVWTIQGKVVGLIRENFN